MAIYISDEIRGAFFELERHFQVPERVGELSRSALFSRHNSTVQRLTARKTYFSAGLGCLLALLVVLVCQLWENLFTQLGI
jgi:hypothetical protein